MLILLTLLTTTATELILCVSVLSCIYLILYWKNVYNSPPYIALGVRLLPRSRRFEPSVGDTSVNWDYFKSSRLFVCHSVCFELLQNQGSFWSLIWLRALFTFRLLHTQRQLRGGEASLSKAPKSPYLLPFAKKCWIYSLQKHNMKRSLAFVWYSVGGKKILFQSSLAWLACLLYYVNVTVTLNIQLYPLQTLRLLTVKKIKERKAEHEYWTAKSDLASIILCQVQPYLSPWC